MKHALLTVLNVQTKLNVELVKEDSVLLLKKSVRHAVRQIAFIVIVQLKLAERVKLDILGFPHHVLNVQTIVVLVQLQVNAMNLVASQVLLLIKLLKYVVEDVAQIVLHNVIVRDFKCAILVIKDMVEKLHQLHQ